ncbi:hypothetical protein APHAL10511_006976 [Amanita phalloides]|nr:hypothetical protein APHAL10511_006976 [Amanita phalloides]
MSEGIQITIPDFDDDEYNSAPTPFGRSAGHGFGSAFGSVLDSPTITTPFGNHDRSYFPSHSRGDSAASVDSTGSLSGFTRAPARSSPFAHSSQSSIATSSPSPFSKKPSFASIRNAFKSGKLTDAPPVPQLDHQPYPILKNPFNRSTSSLNHTTKTSAAFPRPPTPTAKSSKSKQHVHAKSHHSQTGSFHHHTSDGSDHGHPFTPVSPPPVPRVPNGFGHLHHNDTPPYLDLEDDKVVIDPKTPSDFALHAVFIRFADIAEGKIDAFLRTPLDRETPLANSMGGGVDTKFDDILSSLGKIAQKHAKAVIDSIMRWRRSQNENVGSEIIRVHTAPSATRTIRMHDIPGLLNERKALASIYIMCRALVAVLQSLPKDALGDVLGYTLEETTFDQFRRPELKLLHQSANHRANAELYAILLGNIANFRFMSVTDRFLAELAPLSSGQVPKDHDMKFEYLLKGLQHIQIKVWPPEAFEEGAEFLESLSKSFASAHGQRLKIAFAEILVQLLHPIGKTAQAETNNPQWAKAIETIFPKAREMMAKPRYWNAAFPLAIISLCVAPQAFFLKNWIPCLEVSISKLKEKATRTIVMNGILRLFWTYLYRCPESASSTTSKLETLLKHFFPPNKQIIHPQEDRLEPFIYIVHFIISRHVDYGQEYCLDLMQEPAIKHHSNVAHCLAPERTTIAVHALLLSLHTLERETNAPVWPSGYDFAALPPSDDYPTSSDHIAPAVLSKFGVSAFVDRCMSALAIIALHCAKVVGPMSVLDEQWHYQRSAAPYDESPNNVTRRHMDGTLIAYPGLYTSHINLLRTCFESWPRFYHSSISLPDATDMLLRCVIHVEPSLCEAAADALKRFMSDKTHALTILSRFYNLLFSPVHISEGPGMKLLVEIPQLLSLWIYIVDNWLKILLQQPKEFLAEEQHAITSRLREIEAAALFLMIHEPWPIHSAGVKVIRSLGNLLSQLESSREAKDTLSIKLYIVECLQGKHYGRSYLDGFDELFDAGELARLDQWRQSKSLDVPLRIADSDSENDRKIWRYLIPQLLQLALDTYGQSLLPMRESLIATVSRLHPTISLVAGLSSRVPPGLSGRSPANLSKGAKLLKEQKPLVDQWYIWVKVLCATAMVSEPLRPGPLNREHAHVPSDAAFERERLSTTRGLFRYLTPFLDSEYMIFRDAAVVCISSFPSNAYPQLLEDLSLLASRQFYDDARAKVVGTVGENVNIISNRQLHDESKSKSPGSSLSIDRSRRHERLHSAVARIYYLTAHLLQQQRATGRQAALASVLKFVRNTQAFLTAPDVRDNHTLQRLRQFFCGIVERLFDDLATLKDSDRFIPPNMHLTLYRLCEEWCQLGPQADSVKQRFIIMQRAAASSSQGSTDVVGFKRESNMLSEAAVGALTSLCPKAFHPPDLSSISPTDCPPAEFFKPLSADAILGRLISVLSSSQQLNLERGKKALRTVLTSNSLHLELMSEAIRRAVTLSDQPDSGNARFLEVLSDVICTQEEHGFSFSQTICLGLTNLCNPSPVIRRRAFKMLEAMHVKSNGLLSMSNFEPYVCSLASGTYLHAHRLIVDFLAGEHPNQGYDMLVRVAMWLPSLPEDKNKSLVILLMLQGLESWIPNIQLLTEDKQSLSQGGILALYHLISLTLRYGQTHCEQILTIWSRLVDPPSQSNGHATIRFLLEQSHKIGSAAFISCAANIVACLCQTHIGREIFDDLCSVIEPARMLPTIDHKLVFPEAQDVELWSELDALFAEQPRLQLGSAQFAWLFLTDVALQRHWELKTYLPTLLHVLVIHLDHRNPHVRCRAQRMLFQLIRSWLLGLDELPDRSINRGQTTPREALNHVEEEAESHYWKEDEPEADLEPKLKWFCTQIVELLEPLFPSLTGSWGSVALNWGTSCSIRQTAFRSLQIFRALAPRVKQSDMALLLGRLSNTISASAEENIQPFNCEIIRTISSIVDMEGVDKSLLPQLFWGTCACLSTTVQEEFHQVLLLLNSILTRFPLESNTDLLLSHKPNNWSGSAYIQPLLLKGLRSIVTSHLTFETLLRLSSVQDNRLIDPSTGRVRDLYTLLLPWCLHAMAYEKQDDALKEFAQNVSSLATKEGRPSIQRIMASFAKGSFRTKDDFLRQSVSSLREHYGTEQWTEVVTLFLSLVLNQERWLQVHTMQILKLLFQQRETRNPFELLGPELLMPLLRLLETELAMQALDVLEEPMILSNRGPTAKHVLRMSMHIHTLQNSETSSAVFGIPEDCGWCIPQVESQRETCRANVGAVFDTCSMPTRPSRIDFEPEVEALAGIQPAEDDLGGLVKNLHDLTSYFQSPSRTRKAPPTPNRRLEARVAAILAKSTAGAMITDTPQTPFLDVFRVSGSSGGFHDELEDDDSDSDSEDDAFIFDSPHPLSSVNGRRFR